MYHFTAQQRQLLSALREASDRYYAVSEILAPTPSDKYLAQRLSRVRRALLHDCEQQKDSFEGVKIMLWLSLVRDAYVPTPGAVARQSLAEAIGRDYPSNLRADSVPAPSDEG